MFKKDNRKKVVFLGTPDVAAKSLEILLKEASHLIQIILVVTQPPARSTRHGHMQPSPVHQTALEHGIAVMTPETAKDPVFLKDLEALEPDLCITAAYGNYLPAAFLSIPVFGTLNIHPSLLPCYRGAAPVQRAIENGDKVTGVTVLFTVLKMDAGPIVAQQSYPLDQEIKSLELLNVLFEKGTKLLISSLRGLFSKQLKMIEQSEESATHAPKITQEEGQLDFSLSAHVLHNKIRAFDPWPGARAAFLIDGKRVEIKIIRSRCSLNSMSLPVGVVALGKDGLEICCGDGNVLQILELQPSGKKRMSARDFQNGIHGKTVKIL